MNNINSTQKVLARIKYSFLLLSMVILMLIFSVVFFNNKANYSQEDKNLEEIKAVPITQSKDYELQIEKSVFEGLTKDLFPYKIIADYVNKTDDDKYDLLTINANLIVNDDDLTIKSGQGVLDSDTNYLTLQDDVHITFQGVEFLSEEIQFNLDSNEALSETDIKVNYKNSTINAKRFEAKDSGDVINFEGDVKCNFDLSDF